MIRRFSVIAMLLALCAVAHAQSAPQQPELGVIKSATLSPSYSCRPEGEFRKGYEGTALFLSDFAKSHNSPDLLFNGACGSKDYFQAATHGGNTSLIADLGTDTSLEALAELGDFSNFKFPPPSRYKKIGFLDTVLVEAGHTYAVSLNKHNLRGLFIFTVTDYVPNQRVELRYVVREYDIAANASKSSDSGRAMTGSQK